MCAISLRLPFFIQSITHNRPQNTENSHYLGSSKMCAVNVMDGWTCTPLPLQPFRCFWKMCLVSTRTCVVLLLFWFQKVFIQSDVHLLNSKFYMKLISLSLTNLHVSTYNIYLRFYKIEFELVQLYFSSFFNCR